MPTEPTKPQRAETSCEAARSRHWSLTLEALATLVLAGCQIAPPAPPPVNDIAVETPADDAPLALTIVRPPAIELTVPEPHDQDLLERVRRELVLPTRDSDGALEPAVARELEWFADHQEYLDRVFTRAEPYLYYIVEALEARGMPVDLALLPVIESAFDPFAYSHGRAAGLWQIIPGTGRRLGLKQNWWYDGRRDVLDSTRAALDYLTELAERFDGDWLLAVAGYNSGEGNVVRALRRAGASTEDSVDFWQARPYLPVETRTYVPRLLALDELLADPSAYQVSLPSLPNAPYFAEVDTKGQVDMALAAELAGVDTDTLYELNPGVNRWATDPEGPFRLLVPSDDAGAFAEQLETLGGRERVSWSRHHIKRGETLITIAAEYHTTPAVLREVNRLHGNLIRSGDYLMVPHAVKSLDAYTQTVEARAERTRETAHSGHEQRHVVAAGESLWSIARSYNVGVRELAKWNAMAPGDVLSVGRALVIWTDTPPVRAVPVSAPIADERIRRLTYTVRRGDSLSAIATRFRVTVAQLAEWNSLSPKRYLKPGQRLVMYVDVTKQSS